MGRDTAALIFSEITLHLEGCSLGGQNSHQDVLVLGLPRTGFTAPGALPKANYTSTATQEA